MCYGLFPFQFTRDHPGHCCVLRGRHSFPRRCPPASRGRAELGSAMPTGADARTGRRAGREGELPLNKGAAARALGRRPGPAHLPISQALARTTAGRDGAAAESSGCLQALSGTLPSCNVQLIMEDFKACMEEKAGE